MQRSFGGVILCPPLRTFRSHLRSLSSPFGLGVLDPETKKVVRGESLSAVRVAKLVAASAMSRTPWRVVLAGSAEAVELFFGIPAILEAYDALTQAPGGRTAFGWAAHCSLGGETRTPLGFWCSEGPQLVEARCAHRPPCRDHSG